MGTGRTLIDHGPLIDARMDALFGPAGTMGEFLFPFLLCVTGALVGSFAGASALRIARGDSVVTGRSRCDSCGRVLHPADLVPILSFVALAGRCRTCRAPIDRLQLLAELSGAVIGGAAWLFMAGPLPAVFAALFGWQLLVLALSDWRSFHLPPAGIALLAGSALVLPLVKALQGGAVFPLLLQQLAGAGLGYVLLAAPALAFRALRGQDGMGSADPPLMAAIGAWAGVLGLCFIVLLAAAMGIAVALAMRLAGRIPDRPASPGAKDESAPGSGEALPLGTLLSFGAITVTFAGFSLLTP